MTRDGMTPEAYDKLITSIGDILLAKGLKATTMDSIAATLQISKRTLYEIFESKNEMVICALEAAHARHSAILKDIFESAENVMVGILKGFIYQRDQMRKANVEFIRDMDSLFSDAKEYSSQTQRETMEKFLPVYEKGVKQGFFRKNVNFILQCRLLWIQMESLKRMEEFFPPDITLLEAYDSIFIGFLRAIATPKGLTMLDAVVDSLDDLPTDTACNNQ